MKKVLVIALLLVATPAHADDRGAWVKVDANGNAIGQAIVCTQDVCGNKDSLYNKMTLQPGEKYVLQTVASPEGNVAGVGAGQGGGDIKVNLETGEWTATRVAKEEVILPTQEKVAIEKTTVTRLNKDGSSTLLSETVNTNAVPTLTATTDKMKAFNDWYENWLIEWNKLLAQIALSLKGWGLNVK